MYKTLPDKQKCHQNRTIRVEKLTESTFPSWQGGFCNTLVRGLSEAKSLKDILALSGSIAVLMLTLVLALGKNVAVNADAGVFSRWYPGH
jgi:hypothetical protein